MPFYATVMRITKKLPLVKYVLKPQFDKNAITVVVVRGNPQEIMGLDIRFFQSGKMPLEFGNAYLVTENEFCLLQNLFIEKGEPK